MRFPQIANGSLFEFQTQLEIIKNLEYITRDHFEDLFSQSREIERMLKSLINKLRRTT
ncbi:MAG: four helix bundle protein [Desulfobacterales bacterium]